MLRAGAMPCQYCEADFARGDRSAPLLPHAAGQRGFAAMQEISRCPPEPRPSLKHDDARRRFAGRADGQTMTRRHAAGRRLIAAAMIIAGALHTASGISRQLSPPLALFSLIAMPLIIRSTSALPDASELAA